MNRFKLALLVSGIGTLLFWGMALTGLMTISDVFGVIALIGLLLSYVACFIGGITYTLRFVVKIIKLGWHIGILIPITFLTALVGLFVALAAIIYLPIIPVIWAYMDNR